MLFRVLPFISLNLFNHHVKYVVVSSISRENKGSEEPDPKLLPTVSRTDAHCTCRTCLSFYPERKKKEGLWVCTGGGRMNQGRQGGVVIMCWELLAQSLPWLVMFVVSHASMILLSRTGARRANRECSCQLCPAPSRRGSLLPPSPGAAPHLVLHLGSVASLPACSIIPTPRSHPPAGTRGHLTLPSLWSLPPQPWLVQLTSVWPCVLCRVFALRGYVYMRPVNYVGLTCPLWGAVR